LGYEVREGGKGSHIVVKAPGQTPVTIPRKKPFVKSIYVKFVIELIDALNESND
jgi:predicted RNA binding protein YcfA (HicA-like mRNA interferase family)